MTIEDVLDLAYNAAALPTPRKVTPNRDAAIYKYWLAHREVGSRLAGEYALDDGTRALITTTSKVLHWLGGDEVVVR